MQELHTSLSDKRQDFASALGRQLKDGIDRDKELYASAFGEDLFGLEMTADNLLTLVKFEKAITNSADDPLPFRIREKAMFDNFMAQYARLPKGKYYGQFGGAHVFLRPHGSDNRPLASYLNEQPDSPFRGRVLAIEYEYEQSRVMDNLNGYKPRDDTYHFFKPQEFNGSGTDDLTLFRLRYPDSPYGKSSDALQHAKDGVTADYMQYVLLIRGSEAAEPYGTP